MDPVGNSVQPAETVAAPSARARSPERPAVERAGARPDSARAEVEISAAARERRPASAARSAESAVSDAQRAERESALESRAPSPILAVRVGVPPAGETLERLSSDRALEDDLTRRAQLRDLTQVLSLPAAPQGAAASQTSSASASGESASESGASESGASGAAPTSASVEPARAPAELLGRSGESAPPLPERPQFDLPERAQLAARDVSVERPVAPAPQPLRAEERELRVSESQRPAPSVQSERLTDAAAVLGSAGSGAVRDPNDASVREQPILGTGGNRDAEREADRRQLEASATQFAGAVDARQRDELVTRFLNGVDSPDPGPVPRPRS